MKANWECSCDNPHIINLSKFEYIAGKKKTLMLMVTFLRYSPDDYLYIILIYCEKLFLL